MALRLTTASFRGSDIPKKFACDGRDISPALAWNDPPKETETFALVMDDPDAPGGTWVHWVIYDLPAAIHELREGVPKDLELSSGARQGRNDFGKIGYNGPCPPRGTVHRYFFKLYALKSKMNLKPGVSKGELERAMKGHILAQVELVGKFGH
ncbi:MAG TPA: YbhB/YbcL family Raf kinase inhibitor-like protein [Candidatus Acidoferrales bacterium]|nr:YbhB/YbcL family Raf kinase inhibitor-like protein [Candidatus Acidoferrales bacterium]